MTDGATGGAADGSRWRGHTHEELYRLLHDGPGAAASAEPARRWQEIAASLNEIGEDLRKALEQAGAAWSGKAAGRAYDRLSITATWATETSASAEQMRAAVENQAEHIARARADMPAPEDVPPAAPDPTVAPAVQVAQAPTDLEAREAAASSAEERAFEVMAAYAESTSTNTSAMAAFAPPMGLARRDEVRHGGGFAVQGTSPAGLVGPEPSRPDDHRPRWQHNGGADRWQAPTSGSSAVWTEQRPAPRGPAQSPAPAPAAPGGFSGAAVMPRRESDRERPKRSAGATPGNSVAATQPRAGAPGLPQDMQAAAAGQAAVAAQQHAGAPVAPAAGAPGGGQQERMAMRRFGMEAIGSNQWFGDTEEPAVGRSPRRRRDFREPEEVTESVSILDEEHRLPPNVIGDGPGR